MLLSSSRWTGTVCASASQQKNRSRSGSQTRREQEHDRSKGQERRQETHAPSHSTAGASERQRRPRATVRAGTATRPCLPGFSLRIGWPRQGNSVTPHWMIEMAGRRVVEFWPATGTWWCQFTGEKGRVTLQGNVRSSPGCHAHVTRDCHGTVTVTRRPPDTWGHSLAPVRDSRGR
jgi:hypothetical protein